MVKLTRSLYPGAVPVVILAGFLGAGKTTVLNHVLKAAIGARIAVIVNDFGSVNIDSLLIAGQTDKKLYLTNGCVCCSMEGGELDEALASALESRPDVIIIEASGLAEPEDIAQLITLSPTARIGYGGLVYVVDAVNLHETLRKHSRVTSHIKTADLVVLTKIEHVSSEVTARLMKQLERIVTAPITLARGGALAPEMLFDIPKRERAQLSLLQQDDAHEHLHEQYQSVTFDSTKSLAPEKFRQFMDNLRGGIYRAKGIVYFGMAGYEQKFVVQAVGNKWDMYAEEWDENEIPHTTLVLIGTSFNEKEILKQLAQTVGESKRMLDIERYSKR